MSARRASACESGSSSPSFRQKNGAALAGGKPEARRDSPSENSKARRLAARNELQAGRPAGGERDERKWPIINFVRPGRGGRGAAPKLVAAQQVAPARTSPMGSNRSPRRRRRRRPRGRMKVARGRFFVRHRKELDCESRRAAGRKHKRPRKREGERASPAVRQGAGKNKTRPLDSAERDLKSRAAAHEIRDFGSEPELEFARDNAAQLDRRRSGRRESGRWSVASREPKFEARKLKVESRAGRISKFVANALARLSERTLRTRTRRKLWRIRKKSVSTLETRPTGNERTNEIDRSSDSAERLQQGSLLVLIDCTRRSAARPNGRPGLAQPNNPRARFQLRSRCADRGTSAAAASAQTKRVLALAWRRANIRFREIVSPGRAGSGGSSCSASNPRATSPSSRALTALVRSPTDRNSLQTDRAKSAGSTGGQRNLRFASVGSLASRAAGERERTQSAAASRSRFTAGRTTGQQGDRISFYLLTTRAEGVSTGRRRRRDSLDAEREAAAPTTLREEGCRARAAGTSFALAPGASAHIFPRHGRREIPCGAR
ncbi:Hypothetical predicted protein [Olea europaea subsp. europaea]|uniref:Uncharacterized protein n=1 Tax=Olea europaea subsp. europaea TaxID=158383 RepID=A0A8S0TRG3_OLEEU|nr:Hypothetical predicted protein [Olea europaea subsp. europaea]